MIEFISPLWNYVLPFLVVLTVLVFVHELGHYWVARRAGVRVEVFSIGFGPEIFGFTDKADTRWKFSAIPLGGYVKMFGEGDFEGDSDVPRALTPAEKAVSFKYKSLLQRSLIVFAGPAANFIFAIIVFAGLFMAFGQPFSPADVGEVSPGSAAERAGLLPGDKVIRIDNTEIERFEDIVQIVQFHPETPLKITVLRDGKEVSLTATPDTLEKEDRFGNRYKIGLLGIRVVGIDRRELGIAASLWQAVRKTQEMVELSLKSVGQIIMGTRTVKELGGPIKIAQMSGESWSFGIESLILFSAIISVNLGLINLFPIPMLDGGHLLFYFFEAIRGRPLAEKTQEYGLRIGLAFVLGLMVFVTINDIINLHLFKS